MSDNDSPEQIEREIEQTRAGLSRTLDALQLRLSPGALISDALRSARVGDAFKSAGAGSAQVANALGRTMADHPVPVVLAGVGLTWLAMSSGQPRREDDGGYVSASLQTPLQRRDPSRGSYAYDSHVEPGRNGNAMPAAAGRRKPMDKATQSSGTGEKLRETAADVRARAEQVGQRAAETAEKAKGVVSQGMERVSESASKVAEAVSERAERVSEAVKETGAAAYERTKGAAQLATHAARQVPARVSGVANSAGGFIQDNPIISGAIAVALGAGLALMIPSSRREHELLGDAADDVKASVRERVEEKVDQAKSVVRTAAEAAADAARKETLGKGGEEGTAEPAAGA